MLPRPVSVCGSSGLGGLAGAGGLAPPPVGFYAAAMAPDLKHPATGDLIVLADGEQLWRIGWPGAPVLVITKSGPDGSALYRLADPKCKTWNKVGDMKLVPWPDGGT